MPTPTPAFIFACVKTLIWDIYLTLANKVAAPLRSGHIVPAGAVAHAADGRWTGFQPPRPGDSRSACPALNAMANHGILPRDGKNIPFPSIISKVHQTYNFSETFVYFTSNYVAHLLGRSYARDTFDLADISLHNGIEHDGSLTRLDVALAPDQGVPYPPFIRELLASATGQDPTTGEAILTPTDLGRVTARRRVQARAANPQYSLANIHAKFSASNSTSLLRIFGGKVKDLEVMLLEERIPDGFESSTKAKHGLTMFSFQSTVKAIDSAIDEDAAAREMEMEMRKGEKME